MWVKLLVCYISGLDRRRVVSETTPFLAQSLAAYPSVTVTNLPSNELLPTMLTGVYPGRHGVWGVKLRPHSDPGRNKRWFDALPDLLATSAQCIAHQLTSRCDLPAIPPRRRRRFAITRTKYLRRRWPYQTLSSIGGLPSLLGLLGEQHSRYLFSAATHPRRKLLPRIGAGDYDLDWVEFYSLDRVQQWRGHDDEKVCRYYREADRFLAALDEKCRSNGVTLMVLSDHGYEPVRGSINVRRLLEQSSVPRDEYSYFLELPSLRLWFFTDRAREAITSLFSGMEHVRVLTVEDLRRFHLSFDNTDYGELFVMTEPGHIFFPHDFYQPLANLWLGLRDAKQTPRIADAKQRHNHGYLPGHVCEQGLLLVTDNDLSPAREEIELIDIAPTVLALLGRERPEHMQGKPAFTEVETRVH